MRYLYWRRCWRRCWRLPTSLSTFSMTSVVSIWIFRLSACMFTFIRSTHQIKFTTSASRKEFMCMQIHELHTRDLKYNVDWMSHLRFCIGLSRKNLKESTHIKAYISCIFSLHIQGLMTYLCWWRCRNRCGCLRLRCLMSYSCWTQSWASQSWRMRRMQSRWGATQARGWQRLSSKSPSSRSQVALKSLSSRS